MDTDEGQRYDGYFRQVKVRAEADYDSGQAGELAFARGQLFEMFGVDPTGWAQGHMEGNLGEPLPPQNPPHTEI